MSSKLLRITSYTEDPSLGFPVVQTFEDKTEYRKNCKYVKGKYYIIDKDIFYIESEDLWYRITSGKIEKDEETGKWYLKGTKSLIKGIIGTDSKGEAIFGNFSANIYNNCVANFKMHNYTCINPGVLKGDWFEDVGSNIFYRRSEVGDSEYRVRLKIRNEKSYTNKGYNIEDNAKEFAQKIESYKNYPLEINTDAKKYGKFLGARSFGAEFETCAGSIGDYLQIRHGIVACRDGSIQSAEYVTVPMTGSKGVQNIITFLNEAKKRTQINIECAYHLHFGNLPHERVYLVALYMLCYQIQDDIFKMFPYYKTDHRGIKRKNYCQKLQKMSIYSLKDSSKEGYEQFIDTVYSKIFEFLSDGQAAGLDVNRRQQRHPIERKWERHNR